MTPKTLLVLLGLFTLGHCANWANFRSLHYLFVFGDSYSAVGFRSTSPIPTASNPIGLKYPGTTISKGENWVGVLTTKANDSLILTWDYAVSGAQVPEAGVSKQVEQQFIPTAGMKPSYSPWSATNSLFATWIGINDVGRGVLPDHLARLFELQNELYAVGARNFLFLNIPPFDRSPGGNYSTTLKDQISIWNNLLPTLISNFTATHTNTTVFLFDTQALWDEFYANPSRFNITDPNAKGGGLWYDEYHPSTAIQEVIGQRVADFLVTQ